jgi:hypothetical protein
MARQVMARHVVAGSNLLAQYPLRRSTPYAKKK